MFVCGKLHLFFSLEGRDVSGMSSVGQRSAGSSSRLSDSKACKKRKMFFICLTGVFISRFHTTRLHTLLCERQLTLKAEVKVLSAQSKSSIKTISCLGKIRQARNLCHVCRSSSSPAAWEQLKSYIWLRLKKSPGWAKMLHLLNRINFYGISFPKLSSVHQELLAVSISFPSRAAFLRRRKKTLKQVLVCSVSFRQAFIRWK